MARRPVFIPCYNKNNAIDELFLEFKWHPGFAEVQKKKNVAGLHEAARGAGLKNVLEVSTKSESTLGYRLSAFNLKVELSSGSKISLESAYQGSKIFANGGPYKDLYFKTAREAKKDPRLKSSGTIVGFEFDGLYFDSEPKNAFYDWLYLYALKDHADFLVRLLKFDAFSDIEFNPEKSLNSQARSCALLAFLIYKGEFPRIVYHVDDFYKFVKENISQAALIDQPKLM